MPQQTVYLGDSVYADFRGYDIKLYTDLNAIYIDAEIYNNLKKFAEQFPQFERPEGS